MTSCYFVNRVTDYKNKIKMNRTQQKTIALLEHLFGLGEAQRIYDALSDEKQSSLDVVRLTESIKRSHDKIR